MNVDVGVLERDGYCWDEPAAEQPFVNAVLSYKPNDEPYRWLSVPRWCLWEGGFLLAARAQGVVPSHAHHAIQIVIALDGTIAICGKDDRWRESRGIVVRPDAEHSFDCNGALGVVAFVDPESSEGAWLF